MRAPFLFASLALLAFGCSSSSSAPADNPPPAAGGGSAGTAGSGGSTAGGAAGSSGAAPVGPAKMGKCSSTPDADPLADMRKGCTFAAGARVADTLGLDDAKRKAIPIQHVIVLMKENRSYDEIYGELSKQGQPGSEPVPDGFANPDQSGVSVARYHEPNTCFKADPGHQWQEMHDAVDGGKMDGFVVSAAKTTTGAAGADGHFVMGYYDQTDLPFYYWLANTFAIADRYYPSLLTGTWPNRDFLLYATNDGVKYTGDNAPTTKSIMDALDAAGVSWMAYTDGIPFEFANGWVPGHPGTAKMADFYAALADGSLPAVSFVDGKAESEDEHPPADVQAGEQWTRQVIEATLASSVWPTTAIFFTYDEAGGFADHVPPPTACAPDAKDADSTELGVRVPLVVVSPYARAHYVSHVQHEHTSITRFIEALFDLPALTARDANTDALLDMFDFGCTPTELVPDAPASGTGECMKTSGGGGAGGSSGAGGAGGSAGGPGSECASKATRSDCQACCDTDFPLAKVKRDLDLLGTCGCTAGASCASMCSASCPSGPTDSTCSSCIDAAVGGEAACVSDAESSCGIDSDCKPILGCRAGCVGLP